MGKLKTWKAKKPGIKYCVVREDPTQKWKKNKISQPHDLKKPIATKIPAQTAALPEKKPATGKK